GRRGAAGRLPASRVVDHQEEEIMTRVVALVAGIAALFALAVAGSVAAQGTGTATPNPCASPAAVVMVSPVGAPVTSGAVAPSPVVCSSSPTVELVDINFAPKESTIPANTNVTVNLVNKGASVHNFNIDQLNVHS